MKLAIATCVFSVILWFPAPAFAAQSAEAQYRAALVALIELLQKQIRVLQSELEARGAQPITVLVSRESSLSIRDLAVSRFYDGSYTALYTVEGRTLAPIGATQFIPYHGELWSRFVDLAGERFVRNAIQEFRIYDDAEAAYDAFAEPDPRTDAWVVGLNVHGLDPASSNFDAATDRLMLHEIGHIRLERLSDIQKTFEDAFWNDRDRTHTTRVGEARTLARQNMLLSDYFRLNPDRFVSEYATLSPLEDIVETYVAYLTEALPQGNSIRERKIRFFETYSELRAERLRLREMR